MPLHTDLRPKTFGDVVGNAPTIKTLQSFLKRKDRPHTYLFYGESGCGKTTFARIYARELGCAEREIMEIDMGTNRGIETARTIISQIMFRPLEGNVRVYILDEVHKATSDFQNALLKSTEEPPDHIYFILCTTEPEKIILTLRKRATPFQFSRLKTTLIKDWLTDLCSSGKKKINEDFIDIVADVSGGVPRDALMMLEKISGLESKQEVENAIQSIQVAEQKVIDLCRQLLKAGKWEDVAEVLRGIEEEPEKVRYAVLGYMSSVLMKKDNGQAALVIDCFKDPFYNSGRAGLVLACYESVRK